MSDVTDLYPMLIQPRFSERIWGGHRLAAQLGKPAPRGELIGESWEIYEENPVRNGAYAGKTIGELRQIMGRELTGHVSPDELFPLLTKLIDARDVLSVQVHPNDEFARRLEHQPYGKTECWYIIDAAPGSALTYGFARDTSPEEYTRLVEEGKLEQVLRSLPVQAGDVVYIPAGTVHAIGAGILLYELQQTSDVTYRIYDWNRRDAQGQPRELHVAQAREVLDYHRNTRGTIQPLQAPGSGRSMLIAGPYFAMELVEVGRAGELSTHESALPICALDQPLEIHAGGTTVRLEPYSSALLPAATATYTLQPAQGDGARALVAYVPASAEATRQDLLAQGFSARQVDAFLAQFAPAADLGKAAVPAS